MMTTWGFSCYVEGSVQDSWANLEEGVTLVLMS
jgi:hypothetical protein